LEDEELAELINARISEEPCHSYGPRPRCAGKLHLPY
jgi:pyrimidine deaminase RibD-like protein